LFVQIGASNQRQNYIGGISYCSYCFLCYCICYGIRSVASGAQMSLGIAAINLGLGFLSLPSLLQLGTSRFSKISGFVSPCTEQQAV